MDIEFIRRYGIMIIGFKNQFIESIMDGTKIHTIRIDKYERWKSGNSIQMVCNFRTKEQRQFNSSICYGVQRIEFFMDSIWIDGRKLKSIEIRLLALNDGFQSTSDFLNWFNGGFVGKIIHWTQFRY